MGKSINAPDDDYLFVTALKNQNQQIAPKEKLQIVHRMSLRNYFKGKKMRVEM